MSDIAPGISVFNKVGGYGILQNNGIYIYSIMK
jgi:hypothetical protein